MHIEVAGEADDGHEALRLARELAPDVVLMDIRMPNLNGLQGTRRLLAEPEARRPARAGSCSRPRRRNSSSARSAPSRPGHRARPSDHAQAGRALRAPPAGSRPGAHRPREFDPLTEREIEVLQLIARGLTNNELASTLVVSDATVKTHITHLLAKLNARDRVQLAILAYEAGLVEPDDDMKGVTTRPA